MIGCNTTTDWMIFRWCSTASTNLTILSLGTVFFHYGELFAIFTLSLGCVASILESLTIGCREALHGAGFRSLALGPALND